MLISGLEKKRRNEYTFLEVIEVAPYMASFVRRDYRRLRRNGVRSQECRAIVFSLLLCGSNSKLVNVPGRES